jgi:predicted nucleotidyltransferase
MSDFPSVSDIRERLAELSYALGDVAAVYVLGSAATGNVHPGSDIDLAVLPKAEGALSARARLQLGAELEYRLGRSVDLEVISGANLVYAAEAILKGWRILVLDEDFAPRSIRAAARGLLDCAPRCTERSTLRPSGKNSAMTCRSDSAPA